MEVKTVRWELTGDAGLVEEWIIGQVGPPVSKDGGQTKWEYQQLYGLYRCEVRLNSETLTQTMALSSRFTYLGVLITLFSPVILFLPAYGLIPVFVLLGIITQIYRAPAFNIDPERHGKIVGRKSTPYLATIFIAALVSAWILARGLVPYILVDVWFGILFVNAVVDLYLKNALPMVESNTRDHVMEIPLSGLGWLTLPYFWFSLYAFVPGSVYNGLTQFFERSETAAHTSSMTLLQAVTEFETVKELVLTFLEVYLIAFAVYSLLQVHSFVRVSRSIRRKLSKVRITPYEKQTGRITAFGVFVLADIIILLLFLPVVAIIWYGFTGRVIVLPDWLMSLWGSELALIQPAFRHIIDTSFWLTGQVFEGWPIFSADVYAIAYVSLLFWPVFYFLISWVSNSLSSISKKVLVIQKSELVEVESGVVPEDVDVLELDADYIDARPVTLLLGLKEYIVVTRGLVELLEPDELDAVLAHEVYHISNLDLLINSLAGLLALGSGGRNSLLAFYDYPRIELEADDYAAEKIGVRELALALQKIEDERTGQILDGTVLPGFAWSEVPQRVRSEWRQELRDYLLSPYQLYFGGVLLSEAHRSCSARIERILES